MWGEQSYLGIVIVILVGSDSYRLECSFDCVNVRGRERECVCVGVNLALGLKSWWGVCVCVCVCTNFHLLLTEEEGEQH